MLRRIVELSCYRSTYTYSSLVTPASEIRLLCIQPGRYKDRIECDLHHEALAEQPKFEALSYCWGNANEIRQIVLNGHRFYITANLDLALRHLRYEDRSRTLWVDAICINQADDAEKGVQVKRMFEIYSIAIRVLAWTGPADDNFENTLQLIKAIPSALVAPGGLMDSEVFTPHLLREAGLSTDPADWAPLIRFMDREYWTRLWILQELVAGGPLLDYPERHWTPRDRCMIGCGRHWFSRDYVDILHSLLTMIVSMFSHNFRRKNGPEWIFEEPVESFARHVSINGRSPAMTNMLNLISVSSWQNPHEDGVRLIDMMTLTSNFRVSEPRDRIFALLGLCSKRYSAIRVDYSAEMNALYQYISSFSITSYNDLRCLRGNRSHYAGVRAPSWTFLPHNYEMNSAIWASPYANHFSACGSHLKANARIDDEHGILTVHGVQIDSIDRCCGPFKKLRDKMCLYEKQGDRQLSEEDFFAQARDMAREEQQWTACVSAIMDTFQGSTACRSRNLWLTSQSQIMTRLDREQLWRTLTMGMDQYDGISIKPADSSSFLQQFDVAFLGRNVPQGYEASPAGTRSTRQLLCKTDGFHRIQLATTHRLYDNAGAHRYRSISSRTS